MKKMNKKGFTLVETLVIIAIISLIFGIGTYYFTNVINKSKETSNEITYNNIKNSAKDYVTEYKNDIVWGNLNDTCISIQTLISKGFLKEDTLKKDDDLSSIIVTRDFEQNILSEKISNTECEDYQKTVKIPTNKDICNDNIIYNGNKQNIIKNGLPDDYETSYKDTNYNNSNFPKNAGEYQVLIKLKDNKQWEDGTKTNKTVTCKIKKATPELNLVPMGNSDETIGTKEVEVNVVPNIPGTLTTKTSNKDHVTSLVENNIKEENNFKGKIKVTTLATRNAVSYITVTFKPNDSNNYKSTSINYTVGKIKFKKVEKPTNNNCINPKYNGNNQTLYKIPEDIDNGYYILGNSGKDIGEYTLTAKLNYGYTWTDGTTNDINLNCKIEVPTPKVYYTNATCNPDSITVIYGKKYGETQNLCLPNKTGYTFNNWYDGANFVNLINNDTIVTNYNDHNLFAKWTANIYTVSFNANGGSVNPTSKTVTYDSTYGDLPTPTREGYTFTGWYTEKTNGDRITSNTEVKITSNQTLYARWNSNKYTVSFNANGGSVTPTSKTVTYDSTYGDLPTPTRKGYTFEGWYTALNGGSKVTSITKVTTATNHTLYAHWTANTYTVNFDATGGVVSPTSKLVTYNSTYGTLPTPTKQNYTFTGWYTSKSGGTNITSNTKVTITSNQTLYARWELALVSYTVEHYVMNTSGSYSQTPNSTENKTGTANSSVTLSNLTKTTSGYNVTNGIIYSHGTVGSSTVTTTNIGSGSITIKLYYKRTYGTLTTTKGTNISSINNSKTNTKYYYGATVSNIVAVLPNTTGETYTFSGWTSSNSNYVSNKSSTTLNFTWPAMPEGTSITLTASATKTANTYIVSYSCNGGSGTTASSTHTHGVAKNLTANGCSKSGYKFSGWATSPSGTVVYTDKQSVKITSSQTLYAKWTETSPPTVTCDNSSYSWSNTVGKTKIKATDPDNDVKEIKYKKYGASSYSVATGSTFNYSENGVALVYTYATDKAGNNSESTIACWTKFDNMKPYTPIAHNFEGLINVKTSNIKEDCSKKSETLTTAINCNATITKTQSNESAKIKYSYKASDQPTDEVNYTSRKSGLSRLENTITYKDNSKCEETYSYESKSYTTAECDLLGAKSITAKVYDKANNSSSTSTVNLTWK